MHLQIAQLTENKREYCLNRLADAFSFNTIGYCRNHYKRQKSHLQVSATGINLGGIIGKAV